MDQLEKFFEDLFLKKITYQLPPKAKDLLVQIAPVVAIIGIVLMIPAILAIFGMGALFSAYTYGFGPKLGMLYYLGIIMIAVQTVLLIMAFPGLKNKKIAGWRYIYYSALISLVNSILMSFNPSGIVWALIGGVIWLYILFQIKSHYS